jgi:hypothetical protein
MIDGLFLLALAAIGLGLSLATFRLIAIYFDWPLGAVQADQPIIPVSLGVFAFLSGLTFAAVRGADEGGWVIIGCGLLLAAFWTGFLRVGSQTSLFLAPLATVFLLVGWLAG